MKRSVCGICQKDQQKQVLIWGIYTDLVISKVWSEITERIFRNGQAHVTGKLSQVAQVAQARNMSMGKHRSPQSAFYTDRFTKVGDSSEAAQGIHRRKTAVNSLQCSNCLQILRRYITHESSSFHSWSFFKTHLHRERIKGANVCKPFHLKPSTEPWFELRVTQMIEDSSNYSRSGWVTKHCLHRQSIERLAELAHFTEQGQFMRELFPCKNFLRI